MAYLFYSSLKDGNFPLHKNIKVPICIVRRVAKAISKEQSRIFEFLSTQPSMLSNENIMRFSYNF